MAIAAPYPTIALRSTLINYQFLPHDWDGDDGQPAKAASLLDALKFLVQLPRSLPAPSPMLSGSGTIGLYWDRGTHYVSLMFEGDGTYTWLTDGPGGYGGAEGIVAHTLPAALRHYLEGLPDDMTQYITLPATPVRSWAGGWFQGPKVPPAPAVVADANDAPAP